MTTVYVAVWHTVIGRQLMQPGPRWIQAARPRVNLEVLPDLPPKGEARDQVVDISAKVASRDSHAYF